MDAGEFTAGGNLAMAEHLVQGGVVLFLDSSCHGTSRKGHLPYKQTLPYLTYQFNT